MVRLFVPMLHAIDGRDVRDRPSSISTAKFRRLIQYISSMGREVVDPHALLASEAWSSSSANTSQRLVCMLTFDDGNASDYTIAYPELCGRNYNGLFFITTGSVGTDHHMTWGQIKEMAEGGMVIGSHTHTHRWLPRLSLAEIREELGRSKMILEDKLGREVAFFGVPGGYYNRQVLQAANDVGYRLICTSDRGFNDIGKPERPLVLRRFGIDQRVGDGDMQRMLCGAYPFKMRLIGSVKSAAARVVGIENFERAAGVGRFLRVRAFGRSEGMN
ncbi:MAG: polysaccharide deacetylase family protein [Chloroflexi bacterium]|nr:polysaccharide deacetylase family protein [Chloroflexota bacterium]